MNNENNPIFDRDELNSMDEHAMTQEEKITAYALGEMTGDDAAEIEALIANDEDLRSEVEAIRAVAGDLTTTMADEPAPALTDAQREMLLSETDAVSAASKLEAYEENEVAEEASPVIYTFRAARWGAIGLAAAAILGLAFVWPMMTQRADTTTPSEVAIKDRAAGLSGRSKDETLGNEIYLGTELTDATRENRDDEMLAFQMPSTRELESPRALLDELSSTYDLDASVNALRREGATDTEILALLSTGSDVALEAPDQPISSDEMLLRSIDENQRQQTETATASAGGANESDTSVGRRRRPVPRTPALNVDRAESMIPPPTASASPSEKSVQNGSGAFGGGSGGQQKNTQESIEDALEYADQQKANNNFDSTRRTLLTANARLHAARQTLTPEEYESMRKDIYQRLDKVNEEQAIYEAEHGESEQDASDAKRMVPNPVTEDRREALMVGDIPAIGELFQSTSGSREGYAPLIDNPFKQPTGDDVFSTFSIDVDTASYSNVRRFIESGALPPAGAVRIEELINYFTYDYETPTENADAPFTVDVTATSCPWNPQHRLVRIGLKGYEIPMDNRPATNLVFLIDVSGSMGDKNKLPLVKQSLHMLVNALNGDDRLAMVVYAGQSGVVLDSTPLYEKETIAAAIDSLHSGGSTHGSAGIQLAYEVAQKNFIEGGANRVVLCTDGDFNVGVTSDDELVKLIEEKRKTGVFLSVLGYGTGNYQDAKMEQLSNHGNGVSAYIDSLAEARKVLVDQAAGTLVTIAKDVKIQVDFNPKKVEAYRLIGYANRMLAAEDFNDDTKDAGEIGAGHTVTALYEIVPVGVKSPIPHVDPSKYAKADASENESMAVENRREDASDDQAPATETATRDTASGEPVATESESIDDKLLRIRKLQEQYKYDEALVIVDEILALDNVNPAALTLKDSLSMAKQFVEEANRQAGKSDQTANTDKEVTGGRVIETFEPMEDEMLTVRLRFKKPDEDESTRFDVPLIDNGANIDAAHPDVKFAAAVAEFGMLLRGAEYMGGASWAQVLDLAEAGRGEDVKGYRAQFIDLVQKARAIAEQQQPKNMSR